MNEKINSSLFCRYRTAGDRLGKERGRPPEADGQLSSSSDKLREARAGCKDGGLGPDGSVED